MASLIAKISNLLNGQQVNLNLPNKSRIGDLVLDAALSEDIDLSSTVTKNPIENESSVADHIYLNPISVKMTGSITDSSFDIISSVNNLSTLASNISNSIRGVKQRSLKQSTAYEILKDTWQKKSVVSIVNYLDSFDNMVIENLRFPTNQQTGDRLYFEVDLVQITTADVETVNISGNAKPVQDMISSKVNYGTQSTSTPTPEENTKIKSGLANAADYFRG